MSKVVTIALSLFIATVGFAQQGPLADSLALRVFETAGGAEAWSKVPYVVFSQAVETNRTPIRVVRHLWNRETNQYRMEIPGPADEPYVVLFDIDTRQGSVYWDSFELEPRESSVRIEEAYQRFVHDTFWLLAPMYLFDAGVERSYLPDSSNDALDVLHIRFSLPDRAPATEFYLYIDRGSGLVTQWKYRAPSDAPDGPLRGFEWRQYESFPSPGGELLLSTRKRALGRPHEVVTRAIQFPREIPEDWLTNGEPKLTPRPNSEE